MSLAQVREFADAPVALAKASRLDVAELSAELHITAVPDPALARDAQSFLRIYVKDVDAAKVGKPFTTALIEAGLSSYPGYFPTTPPAAGTPYGVFWPSTVAREQVAVRVHVDGVQVMGDEVKV